eukprot:GHVS01057057.1.p1 GENE.GHVS01057057.1~~GHVS01057057.1.p1  ORF type:complete len:474 (-),score=34.40 GHVS01057057.1:170-1591(-)
MYAHSKIARMETISHTQVQNPYCYTVEAPLDLTIEKHLDLTIEKPLDLSTQRNPVVIDVTDDSSVTTGGNVIELTVDSSDHDGSYRLQEYNSIGLGSGRGESSDGPQTFHVLPQQHLRYDVSQQPPSCIHSINVAVTTADTSGTTKVNAVRREILSDEEGENNADDLILRNGGVLKGEGTGLALRIESDCNGTGVNSFYLDASDTPAPWPKARSYNGLSIDFKVGQYLITAVVVSKRRFPPLGSDRVVKPKNRIVDKLWHVDLPIFQDSMIAVPYEDYHVFGSFRNVKIITYNLPTIKTGQDDMSKEGLNQPLFQPVISDNKICEVSLKLSNTEIYRWLGTLRSQFTLFFEARCFGGITQRFIYDMTCNAQQKGICVLWNMVSKEKQKTLEEKLESVKKLKDNNEGFFTLKVDIAKGMCSEDSIGVIHTSSSVRYRLHTTKTKLTLEDLNENNECLESSGSLISLAVPPVQAP